MSGYAREMCEGAGWHPSPSRLVFIQRVCGIARRARSPFDELLTSNISCEGKHDCSSEGTFFTTPRRGRTVTWIHTSIIKKTDET